MNPCVSSPLVTPSPDPEWWRNRRLLLTGHTGFKGAWFTLWLSQLGVETIGVALPPETDPNLFTAARLQSLLAAHYLYDLTHPDTPGWLLALFRRHRPQILIHLAAQALVPRSYRDPLATWRANLLATLHLLEAVRQAASDRIAPEVVLIITTDKVYASSSDPYPYRENDPLGGDDPYSASKAAVELALHSYRRAYLQPAGIAVASARAGNVIGGGDWAEARLIPDAVRAWSRGETLYLRHPEATRPFQHVLEPLAAYLHLIEHLLCDPHCAGAYNFGPPPHDAARVLDLIAAAAQFWGDPAPFEPYPHPIAFSENPHLALETALARYRLGIAPRWSLPTALRRTISWYRAYYAGEDPRQLCQRDLIAWSNATSPSDPL
ncbi:MAG: CDP-glucose 4,6-dehydratase [Hydrogenophilus sp.]|nr:CDP-glucose 4,6-dehydratase [Hydrogenophilus sp.]